MWSLKYALMSMAALYQIHPGASAEELYSTIIVNRFPLTIIFFSVKEIRRQ
jgi:hypothetical protein